MPSHPDRVRTHGALPVRYRFGDAGYLAWRLDKNRRRAAGILEYERWCDAEQLARRGITANVIEGDHH